MEGVTWVVHTTLVQCGFTAISSRLELELLARLCQRLQALHSDIDATGFAFLLPAAMRLEQSAVPVLCDLVESLRLAGNRIVANYMDRKRKWQEATAALRSHPRAPSSPRAREHSENALTGDSSLTGHAGPKETDSVPEGTHSAPERVRHSVQPTFVDENREEQEEAEEEAEEDEEEEGGGRREEKEESS